MNQLLKISALLLSSGLLLVSAQAGEAQGGESGGSGTLGKVEGAVTQGAAAATRGIERGGKAGMSGFQTGVNAVGRVTGRVVRKLGGDPNAKPAPVEDRAL